MRLSGKSPPLKPGLVWTSMRLRLHPRLTPLPYLLQVSGGYSMMIVFEESIEVSIIQVAGLAHPFFRIELHPSPVIAHAPASEVFVTASLEHVLSTPQPTNIFPRGAAMDIPQRGASDIWVRRRPGVNHMRRRVCGRHGNEGLGDVDDHVRNGVKRLLRSLVPLLEWFKVGSDNLWVLAEDVPMYRV